MTESEKPGVRSGTPAALSVEALIGDLVHVFREVRPGSEWPALAVALLEHHDPPIPEDDLSPWYGDLQQRARALLESMASGTPARIETSIAHLRALEGVDDLIDAKSNTEVDLQVPDE